MKWFKKFYFLFILLAFPALGFSYWNEGEPPVQTHISAGVSYLDGSMICLVKRSYYETRLLGGPNLPYMIQAEYPIECPVAEINLNMPFNKMTSLQLQLQKNIGENTGKAEYSEWGSWLQMNYPWANYYTRDIASKSDDNLDMWKIKMNFLINIPMRIFFINISAGLEFQYYHYELNDTEQWYPSYHEYTNFLTPDKSQHSLYNGVTGEHTFYSLPLVCGMDFGFKLGSFTMAAGFKGLAGIGYTSDEDKLLNRSYYSDLFMIGIRGNTGLDFDFLESWTVSLKFQVDIISSVGWVGQNKISMNTEENLDIFIISGGLNVGYSF